MILVHPLIPAKVFLNFSPNLKSTSNWPKYQFALKTKGFDDRLRENPVAKLPSKNNIKISRFSLFFIGLLVMAGLGHSISYAAEDDLLRDRSPKENRFRLGPTLDEVDKSSDTLETSPELLLNHDRWNQLRREREAEEEDAPMRRPVRVSSTTVEPPKPPPGQIYVELPYESSLSITGRKVIKVEIKNTHVSADRARELGSSQDTQSFNMDQELQAKIQGTVARKTTINVNFDDTKENVRDFSVVYKGDPGEVVQEAAFGDIMLSLPSTQFVNYSKQLFGVRAALKYKRLGFMAIGSRTKGNTETKRFVGATKRIPFFINDTNYIRYKYFDLTFTTSTAMVPILAGHTILPISDTVPESVYIQDTTGNDPRAQNYIVASPTAPASATGLTLRMRPLSRGVDYSIDKTTGVITFNTPPKIDERVVIDFTFRDGTRLSSLAGAAGAIGFLIKDGNPEGPEVGQEIKRYYSAGARNIVRDNGLGNFILKLFDKDRAKEIGSTLNPQVIYPSDNIEMNFETGIFRLKSPLPFPDIYGLSVNPSAPLNAVFSLEYNAIVRAFDLRPNIVLQSETVIVDGRKVNRDLDYFIDYDFGRITFFSDDLIRESTVIEVTYEFAPFGGQLGETLVGARGTLDIINPRVPGPTTKLESWTAGSTVLYSFGAKPTSPPDVRSAPTSLLVTEADTNIKGVVIPFLPFKTNFAVEAARSSSNPNLYGKALVDSMEGIKQEDASPLLQDSWQVASVPLEATYNTVADFRGRELTSTDSHLRWDEVDVAPTDPNSSVSTHKRHCKFPTI
jgi:hypothetical protein